VFGGSLGARAGTFTLEAIEGVCTGVQLHAVHLLDALVDASLVQVERAAGEVRYRLLETARTYARRKLESAGETNEMSTRHLTWFADFAQRAEWEVVASPEQDRWMTRIEADHDNLRAALTWALDAEDRIEHGLRLAAGLWSFWWIRGYEEEGCLYLERLLNQYSGGPSVMQAKALNALAFQLFGERACARAHECLTVIDQLGGHPELVWVRGWTLCTLAYHEEDLAAAARYGDQALDEARRNGDVITELRALYGVAELAHFQGDLDSAIRSAEACIELGRQLGTEAGLARCLHLLGRLVLLQGETDRAKALWEEALNDARHVGYREWQSWILEGLADIADQERDLDALARYVDEHERLVEAWGQPRERSRAYRMRGYASLRRGDLDEAEDAFKRALETTEQIRTAIAVDGLGAVELARGDVGAARALFEESERRARELPARTTHPREQLESSVGIALLRRAHVSRLDGELDEAELLLIDAIAHIRMRWDRRGLPDALHLLGSIRFARGNAETAVWFFAAADAAWRGRPMSLMLDPHALPSREAEIADAREALGDDLFDTAWAFGSAETLDEMLRWATRAGPHS
jgi:tetratricopeptide (TPR) repeat protein